jgi:hypothetical protein
MKKNGLISAIAIMATALLSSCERDYTCTCTSTDALGNTSTQTYDLDDQTRVDAIENCENFEADNAWVTRNCNL